MRYYTYKPNDAISRADHNIKINKTLLVQKLEVIYTL